MMTQTQFTPIQRRLQVAGVLVIVGLHIETITLFWSHPIAFVLFLVPGMLFMLAGILYYLWPLVVWSQEELNPELYETASPAASATTVLTPSALSPSRTS